MKRMVLISGPYGAGKSTLARSYEQRGYRVMENIPLPALSIALDFLDEDSKSVLIVSLQEAEEAKRILKGLAGVSTVLILLDAADATLIARNRRYRRIHPRIQAGLSLEEAMLEERKLLEEARIHADYYFDTMGLQDVELASLAAKEVKASDNNVLVRFMSFGYKYGVPQEADIVFDCRNVPNPYWDEKLRSFTGKDEPVIAFLDGKEETHQAFDAMANYLDYFLAKAKEGKKPQVFVCLGCTGGQHRSVYFASRLAKRYENDYVVFLNHRELGRILRK